MSLAAKLVAKAFRESDQPSNAESYLDSLRGTMKDLAEAERRSILLSLLVAATIELMNRAAIAGVTIGAFQINDLSLIRKALPVVFAYLIFDTTVLGARYLYSLSVYRELMALRQPALWSSELDRLLLPHTSSLFGPVQTPSRPPTMRILALFRFALRIGSLLSPAIIEAYALYRLFDYFGINDPVVWVSAVFSLGFFAYAAIVYVSLRKVWR